MTQPDQTPTERLQWLTDQLLVRDADVHATAIDALAEEGDDRVVPHLVELLVIDSIANDWEQFGFPAALRSHDPPRYLELPEVTWPGVREALAALAEPDFDSAHAWVEWESWYSQQEIEPLDGFEEWKLRLFRSYLPPVGGLLDCEPREFDLQEIRWGNCDRSFLAALNGPRFVPGEEVETGDASDASPSDSPAAADAPERYLDDDHVVFGFEIEGVAYAVPRWVLFPHELLNAELQGVPVSLTYCTLCNAPILYDRRVPSKAAGEGADDDVRTFGSSGMLASGNKVMYDEESETLWDQHAGTPIGGETLAEDPDLFLDQHAVTQTEWGEWKAEYPDTLALDIDTGYGYDYSYYDGNVDFFEHYWNREEIVQPGVRKADGALPEKESVYGIVVDDPDEVWIVSIDDLREREDPVLEGEIVDRDVVALLDATDDIAVYEAPPTPVERVDDEDGLALVDADGTRWTVARNELTATDGETRERIPGRHGLWFAFRTHYDSVHILE
ncbi:DUF3179 domain-containing (seleno)protein [Halobellus captivus]|uniref:DUF3179 domain-containing (seleno)protein n=1 Tax=Halobellus captivus TaxID=2592614 RepID=UPI0011A1C610|nr:DUF3179 domain-containing (seleno)protein [Halobellus captivus]